MENRLRSVRKLFLQEKIDALLICSTYNIFYLTNFNGFGTHEREGYALLTNSNIYIITDPRLSEGARENSISTTVIELTPSKKLLSSVQEILNSENIKNIGFEEHLTYSEYKKFSKLKNIKLKLCQELIEKSREIKDTEEISNIKKACDLTDKTFSHILKFLKIGVTEEEVAWEIEKYIRENGGELSFPSIVAFGKNSAVPHHKSSNQKLTTNSIILLDFGAKANNYCSDMTRTVFYGKADDKFKEIYNHVLKSQEKALDYKIKNDNLTPHLIDAIARNYLASKGFPTIPHSVGHGVGLQVHELPHISSNFNEKILPKSVFTIEPGVYENNFGGVRIEDTVYFNGKEIVTLTASPKNLIEM